MTTYTDAQLKTMDRIGFAVDRGKPVSWSDWSDIRRILADKLLTERQAGSSGDVLRGLVDAMRNTQNAMSPSTSHISMPIVLLDSWIKSIESAIQPPQPPTKESVRGVSDPTYAFESALAELIEVVDPDIDTGDILADARTITSIYRERRDSDAQAREQFANRGDGDE